MNMTNFFFKSYNKIFTLSECKIFIILFIYVTFILFIISPDSYTHDLYGRCDSAWFFMCGKAWMNGMIPYVDFTDSKGPLLWLIYGIGYLIDNFSYVGIFWLSCINYTISFFLCFKIALLLTKNPLKALYASFCMVLPFFLSWFHYEIRAEDFCYPYIIYGLYFLIKSNTYSTKRTLQIAGIGLGIGFSACLLIKWSIAIMFTSIILSQAYVAKEKRRLKCFGLYFFVGLAVTLLPFTIYFLIVGNFSDFINEYFNNTSRTISVPLKSLIVTYIIEWINALSSNKLIYVLYLVGLVSYYKERKGTAILPMVCFCFFFSISIHHDYGYYTTVLAPFAIFILIYIINNMNKFYFILLFSIILAFQYQNIFKQPNLFFHNESRKPYYEISYLMSQVENPKIINECHEIGIGLPAHTLPGTKFWSKQSGETKEMEESRHNAIKEGQADFIIYSSVNNSRFFSLNDFVLKAGYTYYGDFFIAPYTVKIYGKPGLKLPPRDFSISNMDILFKRKIFYSSI